MVPEKENAVAEDFAVFVSRSLHVPLNQEESEGRERHNRYLSFAS